MAYDFSQFSPQSFERLIQAMAVASCGAKTQIYGAGADGAREATFEGTCRLGDVEWNGYVVFQAKYRAQDGEPKDNAAWLIKQIDVEFAKFSDKRRALKQPDYYVFASNVRLSAGAADAKGKGEGGIDAVERHLKAKAKDLGIKDTLLWHQDTLCSLLDVHNGVRTRYDGWVRPGDLIARLLKGFGHPEHGAVLFEHLAESLGNSREIKSKDVGQALGRVVNLEQVFVDLPVHIKQPRRSVTTGHDNDGFAEIDEPETIDPNDINPFPGEQEAPTAVIALVELACDQLAPITCDDGQEMRGQEREAPRNRVVLFGGPGQGKSSIGQYLAQFYRARLLAQEPDKLAPEILQIVDAVLKCAASEDIPTHGPLRYPFHVDLPRYADRLSTAQSKDETLSILAYLATRVSTEANETVPPNLLAEWLEKLPSIIILDGLDEVPASGNRREVIRAIEKLMDQLHRRRADSLVLVTSRPQGYRDDLPADLWAHWQLVLLEPEAALHISSKVAQVLVSETNQREDTLAILATASEDHTTAQLMTSPLQVMLLFQLAATHNNIPNDRWTLFERHYETLRDREIAKGGDVGNLIKEFKQQIDSIHADAGYLLHVRAEKAGSSEAFLTGSEFEELVKACLFEEELDGDIDNLAARIAKVATERLVFLRSQIEDQVAFDVRSLQEYMAAARITLSPEAKIIPRLWDIAGRAHWQHVVRIVASKIFGSKYHISLRDPMISMIDGLDQGDRCEDDRLTMVGARIALQLLMDGVATAGSGMERKLFRRAFALLESHDETSAYILGRLDISGSRSFLEPMVTERLNSDQPRVRNATLRMLLQQSTQDCVEAGHWIERLLLDFWPEDPLDALALTEANPLSYLASILKEKLRASQFDIAPKAVNNWLSAIDDQEIELPDGVVVASGFTRSKRLNLRLADGRKSNFSFSFVPLASASHVPEVPSTALPSWHAFKAASIFSTAPSIGTAAAFIATVIEHDIREQVLDLRLPWLLDHLVRLPKADCLPDVRQELLAGGFGNETEWLKREASWTSGLTVENIVAAAAEPTLKFGIYISLPPFTGRGMTLDTSENVTLEALSSLALQLPRQPWAMESLIIYATRIGAPLPAETVIWLKDNSDPAAYNMIARQHTAAALAYLAIAPSSPEWAYPALLNFAPVVRRIASSRRQYEFLITAAIQDNRFRFLLPLLARNANVYLHTYIRWNKKVSNPLDLSPLFSFRSTDSVEIRGAVAAFRCLEGCSDGREEETVRALMGWLDAPMGAILAFISRRSITQRSMAEEIVRAIFLGGRQEWAGTATRLLLEQLEARSTPFEDKDHATQLKLPSALPNRKVERFDPA